ncbi:MAG: MobC family plasmid mobilization relaxosome protein [Minwuiales bacterium]|nr:MobC family plasmid mobilization relaxosome protein [Minwuiales bacterium]
MSSPALVNDFSEAAAKPSKPKRKAPPPFSIRFTDEERARLERDAGALSLAAYMRLKLFAGDEPPPTKRKPTRKQYVPSAELAVLGQMLGGLGQSRLASNLNQIAKAANIGALPVSPELEAELLEACAAIQDMRRSLIQALGVKAR